MFQTFRIAIPRISVGVEETVRSDRATKIFRPCILGIRDLSWTSIPPPPNGFTKKFPEPATALIRPFNALVRHRGRNWVDMIKTSYPYMPYKNSHTLLTQIHAPNRNSQRVTSWSEYLSPFLGSVREEQRKKKTDQNAIKTTFNNNIHFTKKFSL